MRETPVPEPGMELERLRVAAALQFAKRTLVTRPPARAVELAQGAVFPLLYALGIDVFDLRVLRLQGEVTSERVGYLLDNETERIRLEIFAADTPLPALEASEAGVQLVLLTNGRRWRGQEADASRTLEFDLFDESFAEGLQALLSDTSHERFDRADERLRDGRIEDGLERLVARRGSERVRSDAADPSALEKSLREEGLLRPGERLGVGAPALRERLQEISGRRGAAPFQRIGREEVDRLASQVQHLRGKLEVRFDGEPVEVTSRAAFYFVLAALALRHGREDAIPADDLVRPPEQPPASRRARSLGRAGWFLLLDDQPSAIEKRTSDLLDALQLRSAFTASQRGTPYPT